MSLKRAERIKREKLEQQRKEEENDDKPRNPYIWTVNEKPKNELTNNRMFRIVYRRILDDCPF